jgi:hypothetical protein
LFLNSAFAIRASLEVFSRLNTTSALRGRKPKKHGFWFATNGDGPLAHKAAERPSLLRTNPHALMGIRLIF